MKTIVLFTLLMLPILLLADFQETAEYLEEMGENELINSQPRINQKAPVSKAQILLIPDSDADVVSMFDPFDGTYLGDFIVDDTSGITYDLQTPINAIQGPLGLIFVSDQIADVVYAFDSLGNFVYIAAKDSLNNIRGIDFRNDTLFVTSGDDFVAMYSGINVFAGYFIRDGSEPFDILFLPDNTCLYCDIQGSSDNVRHYDDDGVNHQILFNINFPEQVQFDISQTGHFLNAAFSDDQITEFLIDGTIINTYTHNSVRGVFRLGNGNILITDGNGVHEIDSTTGTLVGTKYSGSCRFIELVELPLGISEQPNNNIENEYFNLSPNPFTNQLKINYTLERNSFVEINIYSINGARISTINCGLLTAGTYNYIWDGTDNNGNQVEQGVYFITLLSGENEYKQKVNLIR